MVKFLTFVACATLIVLPASAMPVLERAGPVDVALGGKTENLEARAFGEATDLLARDKTPGAGSPTPKKANTKPVTVAKTQSDDKGTLTAHNSNKGGKSKATPHNVQGGKTNSHKEKLHEPKPLSSHESVTH